jgi:hypothetical protein
MNSAALSAAPEQRGQLGHFVLTPDQWCRLDGQITPKAIQRTERGER